MKKHKDKRPIKVIHSERELYEYLCNPWDFSHRLVFSKELLDSMQFKVPTREAKP